MIHVTKAERLEQILREGLRTGMPPDLTNDALWTMSWYETNPVFLANEESDFIVAMTEDGAPPGGWRGHYC